MLAHAVVGWALCGATIGLGRRFMTLQRALVLHAVTAPLIFAAIASAYCRWFAATGAVGTGPLATAAVFAATVVFLDVVVVAWRIEKSFAMFRSVLGTWLPFALIFLATLLVCAAMGAPT